jgi:hypothetical protein
MQGSSWDPCIDITSHCSLGSWAKYSKMFTHLNVLSSDAWAPYWSHVIEGWEHRHHPNVLFLFYEEMNKVTQLVLRKENLTLLLVQLSTWKKLPLSEAYSHHYRLPE